MSSVLVHTATVRNTIHVVPVIFSLPGEHMEREAAISYAAEEAEVLTDLHGIKSHQTLNYQYDLAAHVPYQSKGVSPGNSDGNNNSIAR